MEADQIPLREQQIRSLFDDLKMVICTVNTKELVKLGFTFYNAASRYIHRSRITDQRLIFQKEREDIRLSESFKLYRRLFETPAYTQALELLLPFAIASVEAKVDPLDPELYSHALSVIAKLKELTLPYSIIDIRPATQIEARTEQFYEVNRAKFLYDGRTFTIIFDPDFHSYKLVFQVMHEISSILLLQDLQRNPKDYGLKGSIMDDAVAMLKFFRKTKRLPNSKELLKAKSSEAFLPNKMSDIVILDNSLISRVLEILKV